MTDVKEQNEPTIALMRAVTISREYGSGGGEIAVQLSRRLGWKLVDHEVVEQVASALGVSEADAEAHDEHSDSLILRVLSNIGLTLAPVAMDVPVPATIEIDAYDEARRRIVEAAVEAGHTIIVGRGAQVLLAAHLDVLHVRVVAPLEKRIAYVMLREDLDQARAQARIQTKDRDRAHFLTTVHHRRPEDGHLYDLVVNTAVIELNDIVDILVLSLAKKGRRLNTPEADLGPGAGLRHYPGFPGNFNMIAGSDHSSST